MEQAVIIVIVTTHITLIALDLDAGSIGSLLQWATTQWDNTIYHEDLLPVACVMADMAGRLDSPLYGMFGLVGRFGRQPPTL